MNMCQHCQKKYTVPKFQSGRSKYCSDQCNKRAYYLRNHKGETSLYGKESEKYLSNGTGKGKFWERIIGEITGWRWNNEFVFSSKPDFENEGIYFDIKASSCYLHRAKQWAFVTNNKNKPDFYVLILLDGNCVVNCYKVPSSIVGKGITLGRNSKKYLQYKDADLLSKIKKYEP